jgi:anti-anti-sigma factor
MVVVVTDPLDDEVIEQWGQRVTRALASRPDRLIIDLTACPRIDAAAIVLLLQIHRQMECTDAQLILRRPAPPVRHMLSMARIDHVLQVEQPEDSDNDLAGAW